MEWNIIILDGRIESGTNNEKKLVEYCILVCMKNEFPVSPLPLTSFSLSLSRTNSTSREKKKEKG